MNHIPKKNVQSTPKNDGQPATLTTYGSTVFKFNRSEKKWKEKGSGDVTFSLKLKSSGADLDQLVVSVGKLSFIVQGGVRPKGSKAIVMRGKEVRDVQGEAIILAVRFEHERDSRNLFQMLSSTPWIRPQRSKRPSKPRTKSRRSGKKPPPPWFMATGTREQENIRALVSNAQIAYLEDGTIQRQLATIYKLTPQQIDEAIDFFQPWLKLGNAAGGGSRSFSIGTRTDVSSLPSIHTGKLDYKPMAPLQRVRSPKQAQPSPYPLAPYQQDPKMQPLGSYPKAAPDPPPESKENTAGPQKNPPSPKKPPRADANSGQQPAHLPNSPNAQANRRQPGGYESNQQYESNARSSRKGSRLPIIDEKTAPLTAQNLLLHNKMLIPIKGNFRASVTTWLRKTHGPNPDDPSDGL